MSACVHRSWTGHDLILPNQHTGFTNGTIAHDDALNVDNVRHLRLSVPESCWNRSRWAVAGWAINKCQAQHALCTYIAGFDVCTRATRRDIENAFTFVAKVILVHNSMSQMYLQTHTVIKRARHLSAALAQTCGCNGLHAVQGTMACRHTRALARVQCLSPR